MNPPFLVKLYKSIDYYSIIHTMRTTNLIDRTLAGFLKGVVCHMQKLRRLTQFVVLDVDNTHVQDYSFFVGRSIQSYHISQNIRFSKNSTSHQQQVFHVSLLRSLSKKCQLFEEFTRHKKFILKNQDHAFVTRLEM